MKKWMFLWVSLLLLTFAVVAFAENGVQDAADAGEAALPQAYAEKLACYREAITKKWEPMVLTENELSFMLVFFYDDAPFEHIGYTVTDINGDGVPELLVGTMQEMTDDFYGKLILDLYTLTPEGAAHHVFGSMERDRIYYAGDGKFAHIGSSSAMDGYETTEKLEDGELIDMTYITPLQQYVQLPLTAFEH